MENSISRTASFLCQIRTKMIRVINFCIVLKKIISHEYLLSLRSPIFAFMGIVTMTFSFHQSGISQLNQTSRMIGMRAVGISWVLGATFE